MTDLVVVVPSRGRPEAARELAETFEETCTADTRIVLALDGDDPALREYDKLGWSTPPWTPAPRISYALTQPSGTMVSALNIAALSAAQDAFAVGFQGDDHRPRTKGWDQAYLDALRELGTGIVYGDDLLQRRNLPTQCAMTADIVRTLGFMAPPTLVHLYIDNFWLELGRRAECIRYLPDVVVEHRHPVAGKAQWDEGYERVNDPGMYAKDERAFREYYESGLAADVEKVRQLAGVRQ